VAALNMKDGGASLAPPKPEPKPDTIAAKKAKPVDQVAQR
jgi:hypothetical protein